MILNSHEKAWVDYAQTMKNSGTYELRLSASETDSLYMCDRNLFYTHKGEDYFLGMKIIDKEEELV